MRYQEYFDNLAPKRARDRKKHSYYWNNITSYCNYFSHEENSVLEIGCGTGELIHEIKGKRKVGIDFSPKMIEVAKIRFPEVTFHTMAAEQLEL
ncbi:MAG: class I SAM-dependent methyltransferase, partial [Bacteroidota bacterium]